jgi:integrase
VRLLIEEKAEKAPIAASRLLAVVRRMFNWAMEQAVLEHSPATRIKAPAKENSKERVLSPMEIRSFWNATDGATAEIPRALKLVLATGQRPGEVMGARWEEFDLEGGWWTIPGERAKNGRRTVKRTASPSRPWP